MTAHVAGHGIGIPAAGGDSRAILHYMKIPMHDGCLGGERKLREVNGNGDDARK